MKELAAIFNMQKLACAFFKYLLYKKRMLIDVLIGEL